MSQLIRRSELFSLLFFLLYPLLTSSFSTSSLRLCHHDHQLALLQLKHSFSISSSASTDCDDQYRGITSHPKILSWKENTDCCSWDGVTCDRVTGHVIGLDLSCGQLQGTIHSNSSLFLLPHLQCLNLAFNDFYHSPISSEFGQFASLTHFNLSRSNFSGHIPSEISHLSKLVSLDFSVNYDYTQGSLLRLLRLNKPNLKKLVQNLTELRMLDLSRVDLSSVDPSSLMNLSSSLTTLRLQSCGLRGKFPNEIFHLPNLQKLYLGDNHNLTGYFPKFNGSSPLKDLDLSEFRFSGESILASFGNLTQISTLWLYSNNFSGPIPSSFSKLKHLTDLDLSYNHFSGSIPMWLGNLTQVSTLWLASNNFSGQIPSSLSKLEKLTRLYLYDNHFSGPIPAWLDNLTQMSTLDLSYNNFSGKIPSSLSKLDHLSELDLSSNHFNS